MVGKQPRLRIRSIEQLSTLKALEVLERFSYGRLAAVAGVRAETVRSLFSRWEAQGFRLLKEVGAEHASHAGQPPKIYTLAPEMAALVEAAVAQADHLSRPPVAATGARSAAPVEQLNLLDAAKQLLVEAEASEDLDRRGKLAAEAGRLLARSRAVLAQREAVGRGSAGEVLKRDLAEAERQLALVDPERLLKFTIEQRAAEFERGNVAQRGSPNQDWLSTLARHYVETEPGGRDAEVAFFAGLLAARGALGETQDTVLDQWLSEVEFADPKDERGKTVWLPWDALMDKFAGAFARVVEYGSHGESWHSLLQASLRGIASNAKLAVVPALHEAVARLSRSVPAGQLRDTALSFLQRYSTSSALVSTSLAANAATTPVQDPYYAMQPKPSDPARQNENDRRRGEEGDLRRFETDFGIAA